MIIKYFSCKNIELLNTNKEFLVDILAHVYFKLTDQMGRENFFMDLYYYNTNTNVL